MTRYMEQKQKNSKLNNLYSTFVIDKSYLPIAKIWLKFDIRNGVALFVPSGRRITILLVKMYFLSIIFQCFVFE